MNSMVRVIPLLLLPSVAHATDDTDVAEEQPQKAFEYVLGYDPDAERSITGGGHRVEPFDDLLREAFGAANVPVAIHPELVDEVMRFDPDITEGETDWFVFPSSWWAMTENGIAKRWADPDEPSPTEKFDLLFFPGQATTVPEVSHWTYEEMLQPVASRPEPHVHEAIEVPGPTTAWELTEHGVYQSVHPDDWWGHCNGLAGFTTSEPLGFPQRPITVRVDEHGDLVECIDDDAGCVRFRRGDLEALFTELWFNDAARMGGQRCESQPDEMERDELGRPIDPTCRDLNPGAFHIAAVHLLGRGAEHLSTGEVRKPPFVIDYSYDWEVWNYPVVAFEIHDWERVTEEAATALVGGEGAYQWNDAATGFIRVSMTFDVLSDPVGESQMRKPADERAFSYAPTRLSYVLEVDDEDFILGGEWIDDPTVIGPDSRELHPDFLWIGTDYAGHGERSNDRGGTSDNPFIGRPRLEALMLCSNQPETCAPRDDGDPDDPLEPAGCGCDESVGYGLPAVFAALALLAVVGRRRADSLPTTPEV